MAQCRLNDFLEKYFESFWSDKIVNVEKRILTFRKFIDEGIVSKGEMLKAFNDFLYKAYYADCPKISQFCAQIF